MIMLYEAFREATKRYGEPSRVRCDQGQANIYYVLVSTCLNGVVVIVEVLLLVVQSIKSTYRASFEGHVDLLMCNTVVLLAVLFSWRKLL